MRVDPQYQTATPKSAQINRRGESSGSCPNDDSVVHIALSSDQGRIAVPLSMPVPADRGNK